MQRQIRLGADQAGERGTGRQAEKFARQWRCTGEHRRHHRQRKVEVVDRKTDRVAVGRIGISDRAVAVGIAAVGAVDAGKGVDILAADDQRIGIKNDRRAGQLERHVFDDAFLEREPALQREDIGHAGAGMRHRRADDAVLEVEQHRVAAGRDLVAGAGATVREIGDIERVAALVDLDLDTLQIEGDEVAETDEPELLCRGLERHETCADRDQRIRRVQDIEHRREQAEAEVEVLDHQADRVVVDDAVVAIDITVAIHIGGRTCRVRAASADEGAHIVGAKFNALRQHVTKLCPERALDADIAGLAFLETEVACNEDEVADAQHRAGQRRADRRAAEIQPHRVAGIAGWHVVTAAAACGEVDRPRDAAGGIEGDGQAFGRQLEVFGVKPVNRRRARRCLERGVVDARGFGHQQAEGDVFDTHAKE